MMRHLALLLAIGCSGGMIEPPAGNDAGPAALDAGAPGTDAGAPAAREDFDPARARARFPSTTELMRFVIAPGCAAERNECHNSEDFPDLSTEGNLWNLVGLRCNQGLGEREEIDEVCERLGDTIRIDSGPAAGFSAVVGSIRTVTDAEGEFERFAIAIDRPAPATSEAVTWTLLRDGVPMPALGAGASMSTTGAALEVSVLDPTELPDPGAVRSGDENLDGHFGATPAALVEPGDARSSYLLWRLFGVESPRPRMPLGVNADNPTEVNPPLSRDEMYVLMSWITCMQPGDGPYSEIRYDCPENSGNTGQW